jgi:hypothetical protein
MGVPLIALGIVANLGEITRAAWQTLELRSRRRPGL